NGPTASRFLAQPTQLSVWVDERRIVTVDRPGNRKRLTVPAASLPPGEHRVAVNWLSEFGPAAVGAFRVTVPKPSVATAEVRR
ncbi:MAG: hypothetical protein JOZ54_25195, partial [Acidobacteria bacterium]|nr:hypothetical protein [Acidobacteriota bacterium]